MTSAPRPGRHATFTLERTFAVPVRLLFAAWADAARRARWSAPPGDAYEVLEADLRAGGLERARCGPAGDLRYTVELAYLDVAPERRITYAETVREGAVLLSAALLTVEFFPEEPGSRLVLTGTLDGPQMLAGFRAGYGAALEALAREAEA